MLFWIPRTLAIIFIIFIGIFALDEFVPGKSIISMIEGFLIHLMPNYLLIAALILAWKKEFWGGIVFIFLGIFFTTFFETYLYLPTFMVISFPAFLIGILFLANSYFRQK